MFSVSSVEEIVTSDFFVQGASQVGIQANHPFQHAHLPVVVSIERFED